MPRISNSILIFACALIVGGCGVAATVFDPADLQAPSTSRAIRLDQDYTFDSELGGIHNAVARITIQAGRYEAQYEDAAGMYFLGPKQCYKTVNLNSEVPGLLADCGIFLPNARDLAPRMYVYMEGPVQQMTVVPTDAQSLRTGVPPIPVSIGSAAGALIVNSIVASEHGKPRFMGDKFQPGPVLRAKLIAE